MPFHPVQTRLILPPPFRNSSSAAADVPLAVAEANHVGDYNAPFARRPVADVDITTLAHFEVIRSKVHEPISDAPMINRNLRDSARVLHSVELVGRAIAAGTGPSIDRIEAGLRDR